MRTVSICLVSAALTACVPVISREYDVRRQGERIVAAGCSQSAEVILTTHPTSDVDVVFRYGPDRIRPMHRTVSISFVLSSDVVVKLVKPEALVSSKSKSIPSAVPITTIRRASRLSSPSCSPPLDATYQQPDEPMHRVAGLENGQPVTDSVWVIDIVVSGDPGELEIQLPAILIDDRSVELPPVTFFRKLALTY